MEAVEAVEAVVLHLTNTPRVDTGRFCRFCRFFFTLLANQGIPSGLNTKCVTSSCEFIRVPQRDPLSIWITPSVRKVQMVQKVQKCCSGPGVFGIRFSSIFQSCKELHQLQKNVNSSAAVTCSRTLWLPNTKT